MIHIIGLGRECGCGRQQGVKGQGSSTLHRLDFGLRRSVALYWFSYVYKSFSTLSAMARQLVSPGDSMFNRLIHPL